MGAWSSSLYGNDTTCDVRDIYIGFLEEGLNNQEAYDRTLERCNGYIGCPDNAPLFWFALAESQWRTGRLTADVKANALEWADKDGGLGLWENSKSGSNGWKKTLEKLCLKLNTEQPKTKRFRKRVIPDQNPWALHDIYAYRIHVKCSARDELDLYGKYILMQKIGETKSNYSLDIVMRVQLFDRVFDDVPLIDDALETVKKYRLLPIHSNPRSQIKTYEKKIQGKPDSLSVDRSFLYSPVKMSAIMEQYHKDPSYPQSELTYICTIEGPLNRQHERPDVDVEYRTSMCSWMWHDFHYQIGRQIESWIGVDYEILADGTFEYPTRERQRQIRVKSMKA